MSSTMPMASQQPSFGSGSMNTPGATTMASDRTIDKVYRYEFNGAVFAKALLLAGYRPYQLIRADNNRTETVWAEPIVEVVTWKKPEFITSYGQRTGLYMDMPVTERKIPDLSSYAQGTVKEMQIYAGMAATPETIVLVCDKDGGYTNIHGLQVSEK